VSSVPFDAIRDRGPNDTAARRVGPPTLNQMTIDETGRSNMAGEPEMAGGPEPVPDVPAAPVAAALLERSTLEAGPPVGYGRAPALALCVGGFFTYLGLALSVLALNGTIRPATPGTAVAVATSLPTDAGASPSPTTSRAALATVAAIATPTAMTPTDLASGYVLGRPTVKVTVQAWEDFQCPFCRQFTMQVEPQLVATYVETGKVRLVFRDFAFLGNESAWAAVGAALAEQQGKFWPYHDYLFANQLGENVGSFAVARLEGMADAVWARSDPMVDSSMIPVIGLHERQGTPGA